MPSRWGAGEILGFDLAGLSPERIRDLALRPGTQATCPFRPVPPGQPAPPCNKKGGVCSLRLFERDDEGVVAARGEPVITCPQRFLEADLVVQWVGETLLGTRTPQVISELPFLMSDDDSDEAGTDADAVGKIDKVLVNTRDGSFRWCALEMQAVYFSGRSMENDFRLMRDWTGPGLPFPQAQRRPDFRSSGPKRLMPQLQIKVPTISRWRRKMAVVIDLAFWTSLGDMREVRDLSNGDIAWFVVAFEPSASGRLALRRHAVHFTTLSHAVEGLTGGTPLSLDRFESAIRARVPPPSTTPDLFR